MQLSRDESQAIIDQVNGVSIQMALQRDVTIADHVERLAREKADVTFLIFEDQRISYAKVNAQAEQYARVAAARGVGQGDAVALMMGNCPEFFYVWFGMLKLGACTALINTEARSHTIRHALDSVGCKLAFVSPECLPHYLGLGSEAPPPPISAVLVPEAGANAVTAESRLAAKHGVLLLADELASNRVAVDGPRLRQGMTSAATAAYIFTSGTTGLPKAGIITHSKWLSTGYRWLAMADLHSEDIFYCVLPIFHGAGLMSLFSTVLAVGGTCVLRRKFSASHFWRDIALHQISCFVYVGEICRYLVASAGVSEEAGHSVRIMLGSGMGVDVWTAFTARFGDHIRIYEGWGSTESNCNLCNVENVPGSCGRIPYWDKTFMRMVRYNVAADRHPRDDQGFFQLADIGEVGELLGQIQKGDGATVSPFDGYSDKAATASKIFKNVFETGDRWFRTGDLFRYDEAGYFYFVDRVGDTFRWKAENVSTTEVAQQLSAYGDAELINIYGVKVAGADGRAGMAAVVMVAGRAFDPQAFYQIASANLPSYAIPLFIRITTQMDLTGTFKLRKMDLQAEGYDPNRFSDPLYVLDLARETYSLYSEAGLRALAIAPFE